MKQQSLVLRSLSACLLLVLSFSSCKKVNDATELGGNLIPPVDNVNTFDTTLEVLTYNHLFSNADTSRSSSADIHFVGNISNDPLFGKSAATLFLQLLPQTTKTPFGFSNRNDLIALDSVVLVLSYRSTYGDSTQPLSLQVYEMDQANKFNDDSLYLIHRDNFTDSNAISGVNSVLPYTLNDSVRLLNERAVNQMRLRLNESFGQRLLNYDSTNAYLSDSAFKTYFKGFAIAPQNKSIGNALIGVSLSDTNTKLAVYYRYTKSGKPDTAVTYFRFSTLSSASANYIERDRSGSEFAAVADDNIPDPLVYIQNSPGTFARLQVPGLAGLTNRVVHRAELMVQQVPDPLASILTHPGYLYLDAYDTVGKVYRSIPVDVAVSANGQISNAAQFGMLARRETGPGGTPVSTWRFDISRYIQGVANKTVLPFEFRLSSPFLLATNIGTSSTVQQFFVNPNYAAGRLRVGGGNHPSQPIKLRIIYSKL